MPLADGFTDAALAAGKVEELDAASATAVVNEIDPSFGPSFGPRFELASELELAPLFSYSMENIIVNAH